MARQPRVNQRIRIVNPSLIANGWTFADITRVIGNGFVEANLISPKHGNRESVMLSPSDWQAVPGRPRFPHIDGEAKNFGANRKGAKKEATPAPDAEESGEGEGEDDGEDEYDGEDDGDIEEWNHEEEDDEGEDEGKSPSPEHPLITELKSLITDSIGNALDIVDDKIAEAIAKAPKGGAGGKGEVIVKVRDLPPVKLAEQPHALLERVLKLYTAKVSKRNVMLVGPAGSGKTTLAEQLAQVLNSTFAAISCSPGMSETKVLGRVTPRLMDGANVYEPTPIITAYMEGGVILFDELDNADASILTAFNTMLANGYVTLPNGQRATRHENTLVIGTANTYGHGADRLYVGRNALDGATLDRFTGTTLDMDYDTNVETALCPEDGIRQFVWDIRKKVRDAKLRRIVSTRFLMAVRALHLSGIEGSIKAAAKACATGWSEADLRTAGLA